MPPRPPSQPPSPPAPAPRGRTGLSARIATGFSARIATGLAAAGLATGLGASAALALATRAAAALPGCGPRSACAEIATYPTAALGVAWFAALAASWITATRVRPGPDASSAAREPRGPASARAASTGAACPGAVPGWLRLAALAGALASGGFLVLMLAGGALCPWCLAVHAGSFLYLAGLWPRPTAPVTRGPLAAGLATALVAGGALALVGAADARRDAARAERELARTETRLAAGAVEREGFTGRYVVGAERAAARIVVFTDYQCPDCRAAEARLAQLLAQRADVSLAVKHFPMGTDCNRWARRTLHPNACVAARAAEAAGMLGGAEAFLGLHRWLFARGGSFDAAALADAARGLGLDPARHAELTRSAETLERVQADVAEAHELGLQATPAVFVNGVELRGAVTAEALERAIAAAATSGAGGPAAATSGAGGPAADRPPDAVTRFVEMWRAAPVGEPPESSWAWRAPGDDGPVNLRVVAWVDAGDPGCGEAHRATLAALEGRTGWAYSLFFFPLETSCNPASTRNDGDGACLAARAAEAAGLLGGGAAYRGFVDRLLAAPGPCDGERALALAVEVGLEPGALLARADDAVVGQRVAAKARGGAQLGLAALPCILVNGKHVAQWRPQGRPVLEAILAEAAR